MLPLDAVFPQFRQSFHVKQWRTNAGDMSDYILYFAKCKTPFDLCQFFFVFLQKKNVALAPMVGRGGPFCGKGLSAGVHHCVPSCFPVSGVFIGDCHGQCRNDIPKKPLP
jgi:hypothetical protein